MAVTNSLKKCIMYLTLLVSRPQIILCKLLVKNVRKALDEKETGMEELIEDSRSYIVDNFKCNIDLQRALYLAEKIIEDQWRIRAFKLINSFCKRIDANMFHLFSRRSDNGRSSQNDVNDAISGLVNLASVLFEFKELGKLRKHLESQFRERSNSDSINSKELHDLLTYSADDDEKLKILEDIANKTRHRDAMKSLKRKWNRARGKPQAPQTKQIPRSSCESSESTESDNPTTSGYSVNETESESLDGSDTSNQVKNCDKSHDLMDSGRDTISKEADDPSLTRNIDSAQPDTKVTSPPPAVDKVPNLDDITAYFNRLKDANNRERANISYTSS